MELTKLVLLYVMAGLYVLAGIMHFLKPKFYLRIMPPFIPFHKAIVFVSGVVEVVLGAALFLPEYRSLAAWGVVALLIAVFPANIYHFTSGGRGMKIPKWALAVRLPLQFVLIAWAWWYT
ncbi:MAG: DoxX family protein [Spirochaetia bacterium]|nr:DoxX family protein [Spirochaetia bacterium]